MFVSLLDCTLLPIYIMFLAMLARRRTILMFMFRVSGKCFCLSNKCQEKRRLFCKVSPNPTAHEKARVNCQAHREVFCEAQRIYGEMINKSWDAQAAFCETRMQRRTLRFCRGKGMGLSVATKWCWAIETRVFLTSIRLTMYMSKSPSNSTPTVGVEQLLTYE